MDWPVILTPQSLDDLKNIISFIARDNPERAHSFGNELVDHALSIGNFPELGRIVPELGDDAVREIICGRYRIIYELFPETPAIFVLRFWHGARGIPEIQKGPEKE